MIFSVIIYMKDNTKVCRKCQEKKSLTEFYKHKRFKDGRRAICKCCTKKYVEENSDAIKKYQKEYYKKNEEEIKKKVKEWAEKNPEKRREIANKYNRSEKAKELRKNNINYKLSNYIHSNSARVTKLVKENKQLKSKQYLGCTLEEFKNHIESQWQEGMTWENHGLHGWHIDHIVPVDWFIKNSDDPWEANHYTNLQPLWAKENITKSNKD